MANPFDDEFVLAERNKLLAEKKASEKKTSESEKLQSKKLVDHEKMKEQFTQSIKTRLIYNGKAYITLIDNKFYVLGWVTAEEYYEGSREALDIKNFNSIQIDLLSAGYTFTDYSRSVYDDGEGTRITAKVMIIQKM